MSFTGDSPPWWAYLITLVIEQAKGILMAQQRCVRCPDEAFDLPRRASQRANVKVNVLAAQIVKQVASTTAENKW